MTFTYTFDPSDSDVQAIRFEISDTDVNAPLLQDEEIAWTILDETGVAAQTPVSITGGPLYLSAARCCETLSRRFAAQADTIIGALQLIYSKQAQTYATRAEELRAKGIGMNAPWAGGQSIGEKIAYGENHDQVQPIFTRRKFDSPYTGPGDRPGPGGPLDE